MGRVSHTAPRRIYLRFACHSASEDTNLAHWDSRLSLNAFAKGAKASQRRTSGPWSGLSHRATNSPLARRDWVTVGELVFRVPSDPLNLQTEEDTNENSCLRRNVACIFGGRDGPAVFHKARGCEHHERRR